MEMQEEVDLKKEVKDKFQTIARFCRIANMNYLPVIEALNSTEPTEKQKALLRQVAAKTAARQASRSVMYYEVTAELIEEIRVALLTKYKTSRKFAEETGFKESWLSHIKSGRTKNISDRVILLCELLNIPI